MVALMLVAAVMLYLGGHFAWRGITHHGSGVWEFGGDEPGTGGNLGTDEHREVIPEGQYKRECYATMALFFFFGGVVLADAIRRWKERNDLETSWKRMIANADNIQSLHNNPKFYRDDFKQWIKENRPDLAFWELPPNSSN